MNGLAQLFRALVMESLALVLLFSFAIGRLQQPEAPDSDVASPANDGQPTQVAGRAAGSSNPPHLAIISAPQRARQLSERSANRIGRRIGTAARTCYETALRFERRPAAALQKSPTPDKTAPHNTPPGNTASGTRGTQRLPTKWLGLRR